MVKDARAQYHARRHRSSIRLRRRLGAADGIVHMLRTMLAQADLLMMATEQLPMLADPQPGGGPTDLSPAHWSYSTIFTRRCLRSRPLIE